MNCPTKISPAFKHTGSSHTKLLKALWVLLFVALLHPVLVAQNHLKVNLPSKHDCSNFVIIEGSTNVNKFAFFQSFEGHSKNQITNDNQGKILTIEIPVHNFEASNPLMYDDFLKLIKAEIYPIISIFIHLNPNDFRELNIQNINPKIEVKLAGKQRVYYIPGALAYCQDQNLHVQGSVKINLNDFNLEPPTKFFGMVKVNQEVLVNFGLTMDNNLLTKN